MKPPGARQLSVLLAFTLLLCHGAFGALHLFCYSPECVGEVEHAAEHQAAVGGAVGAHEHPADHGAAHGANVGYFAVLAFGLLGLLLGLLPQRVLLRIGLAVRWPAVLRSVTAAFHPPPTLTPRVLQVFRL